MIFKNKSEEEEEEEVNEMDEPQTTKPIVKNFQMDPEYRKFVLNDEYDVDGKRVKAYQNIKRKTNSNKDFKKSEEVLQNFGKDKGKEQYYPLLID